MYYVHPHPTPYYSAPQTFYAVPPGYNVVPRDGYYEQALREAERERQRELYRQALQDERIPSRWCRQSSRYDSDEEYDAYQEFLRQRRREIEKEELRQEARRRLAREEKERRLLEALKRKREQDRQERLVKEDREMKLLDMLKRKKEEEEVLKRELEREWKRKMIRQQRDQEKPTEEEGERDRRMAVEALLEEEMNKRLKMAMNSPESAHPSMRSLKTREIPIACAGASNDSVIKESTTRQIPVQIPIKQVRPVVAVPVDPVESFKQRRAAKTLQSHFRGVRPKLIALKLLSIELKRAKETLESSAFNTELDITFGDSGQPLLLPHHNKPFIYYEETLLRLLVKADEVNSEGKLCVRDRRRTFIEEVQLVLKSLDEKRKSSIEQAVAKRDIARQQIEHDSQTKPATSAIQEREQIVVATNSSDAMVVDQPVQEVSSSDNACSYDPSPPSGEHEASTESATNVPPESKTQSIGIQVDIIKPCSCMVERAPHTDMEDEPQSSFVQIDMNEHQVPPDVQPPQLATQSESIKEVEGQAELPPRDTGPGESDNEEQVTGACTEEPTNAMATEEPATGASTEEPSLEAAISASTSQITSDSAANALPTVATSADEASPSSDPVTQTDFLSASQEEHVLTESPTASPSEPHNSESSEASTIATPSDVPSLKRDSAVSLPQLSTRDYCQNEPQNEIGTPHSSERRNSWEWEAV
ncbi:hypothetical protein HDU85_003451 [Gaertneriomyces sp. JEL0708]|nr:hypothetical protein HDU85_003451 [Gaertneriomyces sp. JEL0708]